MLVSKKLVVVLVCSYISTLLLSKKKKSFRKLAMIYVRLTMPMAVNEDELVSSLSLIDKAFVGLRNARILNLQVETLSDLTFEQEK
jgi:hypothetical protein